MKTKKIIFLFALTFFLFSASTVQACINPTFKTEKGTPISIFGGVFTVDNANYPSESLQATYNLKVVNHNNQGMFVALEPETGITNYVSSQTIFVPANSEAIMPLQVWIGGLSGTGRLDASYVCDDGLGNAIPISIYIYIMGNGISPPPISTCSRPSSYNGCYQGMYRTYSCSGGELTYSSQCSNFCCQRYGGEESFCSSDKLTCFSVNNLPPPTEGKIAFLCKDGKCKDGNEQTLIFLLRYEGWDVTYKDYKLWTEQELKDYDMIACSDQSQACKIAFNSPIYNAHTEDRKPFLEFADSTSASAAYSFDYITYKTGKTYKDNFVVAQSDPITSGYSGLVAVVNSNSFPTIDESKFSPEVINLGNSGSSTGSMMFKVKSSPAHGRYLYIDWFYKAGISAMTTDGEVILKRALKWLECGENCFGGSEPNYPKIGEVAFLCYKDSCSKISEMNLIKFLRQNSYSVTGKAMSSWSSGDLSNFDFMVCSASTACRVAYRDSQYSPFQEHMNDGKGFLEIPEGSSLEAAYAFGYTNSKSAQRKSTTQIILKSNPFGLTNTTPEIYVKRYSMAGIKTQNLVSVNDIAHFYYKDTEYLNSAEFTSDASGSKGRYAYLGWFGTNKLDNLTDQGKLLLLRTINWVKCGSSSC